MLVSETAVSAGVRVLGLGNKGSIHVCTGAHWQKDLSILTS